MPRWLRKLLSVIDIAKCFMNIPLHPDSYDFFGYRATIDGVDYWCRSKVLIFGWNCAPYICDLLTNAIVRFLRSLGVYCQVFFDDFAVDAEHSTPEKIENNAYILLDLLKELGFYVGRKSSVVPSPIQQYLGFIVDCNRRRYTLPADKRDTFLVLLRHISRAPLGTIFHVSLLERLAGKCSHIAAVLQGARAFIRIQYGTIQSVLDTSNRRFGNFSLTKSLRDELAEWEFLSPDIPLVEQWHGAPWISEAHNKVRFHLSSDACGHGVGGALQESALGEKVSWNVELLDDSGPSRLRTFGGLLPEVYQNVHINIQEMFGVWRVVSTFAVPISNQYVDIYIDSEVVYFCLLSGSSRNVKINDLLKLLWRCCRVHNIRLIPHHIPGLLNQVADEISRITPTSYNRLSDSAWNQIARSSPSPKFWNLDGMATRMDARAPRYISQFEGEGAMWVNLFSYKFLPSDRVYLYPPISMVGSVIHFMKGQDCPWVVVVPQLMEVWWVWLYKHATKRVLLGEKGDVSVILSLSKGSGKFERLPLAHNFFAFIILPENRI